MVSLPHPALLPRRASAPLEVKMPRILSTTRSLSLLLCMVCITLAAAAVFAAPGQALYEERLDPASWSWQDTPEGLRVDLAGARALDETGEPALPVRELLLLVPAGTAVGDLVVEPVASHTERVPGKLALAAPLVASDGGAATIDRFPAGTAAFPPVWGEFRGLQTMRGYVLAAVRVHPFRAVANAQGAYDSVEVLDAFRVRLSSGGRTAELLARQRLVPGERQEIEALLARVVANPQALAGYAREDGVKVDGGGVFLPTPNPSLEGSGVAYLIITRAAMATAFQRLAVQRTAQGLPAVVVTREWIEANGRRGVDFQETLRFFLQDAYAKWGMQYVVIGGDTDIIPSRMVRSTFYPWGGHSEVPADIYYACLDRNWNADGDGWFGQPYSSLSDPGDDCDLLPEVGVGRIPVSTLAAANGYVDKVLRYEGAAANAGWPSRNLFAAEVLFPTDWPVHPVQLDGAAYCEEIIQDLVTQCTDMTSTTMYENFTAYPNSTSLFRTALIDSLNTGHYGIFDQVGHGHFYNMSVGDANFTNNDADALTNANYFLLYALNCASGAFDVSCLMERFVQNAHGGSIVSIGSSREAFPATSNNYQQSFFEALYCDDATSVSAAISASRLPYMASTDRNTVDRWTQLNYNLLGDPALAIWTSRPRAVTITAPASIAAGATNLNVNVTAGGPILGALVCAQKSGETYAYGITDAAGNVVLAVNPASTGNLTVTVTGRNLVRTQRQVPVTIAGAFLACESVTLNDQTGQGAAIGNGNGVAEAGETIELTLAVRNRGTAAATGVVATASCAQPGVQIPVATVTVGDIPAGQVRNSTQKVRMQLGAAIADGTILDLGFAFTATGGVTSTSRLNFEVEAPQCAPVAVTWSDGGFGNGNGIVESNERITVNVALKNYGDGRFDLASAKLRSQSANVTVVDSAATYGAIDLLQTGTNASVFSLRYTNAANAASSPCVLVVTDNYGRVLRHTLTVAAPAAPTTLEADATLGPDTIALRWDAGADPDVRGYHVYRAAAEAGPYTRVNVDLLERTAYYQDMGLAQLTRYYYRVATVDSSLVEGGRSPVISVSTAPPEVAAFPIDFALETGSHTVVGDVDGDFRPEVVVAADEVYVWHASGQELLNGDGDAQTNGPLSNISGQFEPGGCVLANLDGVPGAEIIIGERAHGYKLHVFRRDGGELPGFPKSMTAWNWACPAVGDLDGDGDLEIVVNTIDGKTWAWHHNGTEVRDGDSNPSTDGIFVVRDEGWGFSSPAICDLDGDGKGDIIFGTSYLNSQNGLVAYRWNGTAVAGFPYATGWSRIVCPPAIADIDRNGNREIVFFDVDRRLYVIRQNGTLYPGFPITRPGTFDDIPGPGPAIANLDTDPELEILWPINGGGNRCDLVVVETGIQDGTSGQVKAGWPVVLPGNTESSPVIGDITGDGVPDIVMGIGGGATESPNNLYAFQANGSSVAGFPITLGGPVRATPVLCDLNQDGNVDIVCGSWDRLLHVWTMPAAYNHALMPWPTFHGNTHRDGVMGDPMAVPVPEDVPTVFSTLAPFPNPFNPQITLRLYVPQGSSDQRVTVDIYDLRGRRVRALQGGVLATGWHDIVWDGRDDGGRAQASGVYVLRATQGALATTYKATLVK